MTTDYGVRRVDNSQATWIAICGVVVALVAASGVFYAHYSNLKSRIAQAQAWGMTGAPCPETTAAAFKAQPFPIKYSFEFDDMKIGRGLGLGECAAVTDDKGRGWTTHSVCRFNAPAVLDVQAQGQERYYLTGFGQPAAVSLEHGRLTCLVGPNDAFGMRSGRPDAYPD